MSHAGAGQSKDIGEREVREGGRKKGGGWKKS